VGRLQRAAAAFGPGLVFFVAAVGSEDLVANSAAGTSFGYSLLWTLPLILGARFFILEASARYVLVTGKSLLAGYCEVSRWASWVILAAALLRLHVHHLGGLLLMGGAANLLMPLNIPRADFVWGLVFWIIGFVLMFWGRYQMVEKWCRPLVFVLGGSLAAIALLSGPDPKAILSGAFIPSVPENQGAFSYLLVLAALAGAGANSMGNLKYAAFVHEKGWRDVSRLKIQRGDLVLSMVGILVMSALIQIASASVLGGEEVHLEHVEDLVPLFVRVLGEGGRVVLGLGIVAAIFTTYIGATTGYSLMVADLWRNLTKSERDPHESAGEHPTYRWSVLFYCISPLYVVFTDWKPIWLILINSAVLVVATPIIVLVLMRLTCDRTRMGEHINSLATNLALSFTILVAAYLTYRNGAALMAGLGNLFAG
jgi:Mn2+/Fe2+ NRAMP family transporter